MNAAPCSWRVRMKRTSGVSRSASMSGRFCVPGMPQMWSIPSRSRQSTRARAPLTLAILTPVRHVPHHHLIVRVAERALDAVPRHDQVWEVVQRPDPYDLRHPGVEGYGALPHGLGGDRLDDLGLQALDFWVAKAASIGALIPVLRGGRIGGSEDEVFGIDDAIREGGGREGGDELGILRPGRRDDEGA